MIAKKCQNAVIFNLSWIGAVPVPKSWSRVLLPNRRWKGDCCGRNASLWSCRPGESEADTSTAILKSTMETLVFLCQQTCTVVLPRWGTWRSSEVRDALRSSSDSWSTVDSSGDSMKCRERPALFSPLHKILTMKTLSKTLDLITLISPNLWRDSILVGVGGEEGDERSKILWKRSLRPVTRYKFMATMQHWVKCA